ncbi:MAG: hypothetical protein H0Z19_11640 [Archaeoglobus sp.]|nr:hypothetical protein [Archaeoglobus sp.]MBO8181100.1 hypothetical protein [Archaeoglobus sp.]
MNPNELKVGDTFQLEVTEYQQDPETGKFVPVKVTKTFQVVRIRETRYGKEIEATEVAS